MSSLTLLASTSVISPLPDLTSLGLLFATALIINIKPHAPKKENTDVASNAYASLFFATLVTLFLAFRKLLVV
ncbi:hypothetical protein ACI68E_001906 [Malassezia pachydermatis]